MDYRKNSFACLVHKMRITPSITYRNFLTSVELLNESQGVASQQVASGKKLLHLNDSPAGSAELVGLRDELSEIDQYRSNADSSGFFLGVADSALNSVYNLTTTIFTRVSAVCSETNAVHRASTATEVRALRDQILWLANTEARGRHIFAGSRVTSSPFVISGDTVTYQGDAEVSDVTVADGLEVPQCLVGSSVFSALFDSIQAIVEALDSGDQAAVQTALSQFSTSLRDLSQARVQVGARLSELQSIGPVHDSQESNIKTRISRVQDADLAQAITDLTRIEAALKAAFTARAITGQRNLFDYIG